MHRQFDQAVECYRRALAIRPNFVEAICNLGNLLRERGETVEALQLLEKAYALDPNAVPAVANLGVVLQELGRTDEAQRYALRLCGLRPIEPRCTSIWETPIETWVMPPRR